MIEIEYEFRFDVQLESMSLDALADASGYVLGVSCLPHLPLHVLHIHPCSSWNKLTEISLQ